MNIINADLLVEANVNGFLLRFYAEPVTRFGYDEDGQQYEYDTGRKEHVIHASHVRGKLYRTEPMVKEEALAFMSTVPADFDAANHPLFNFWRTSYGSEDWSDEDEIEMMTPEERHFHGL